MAGRLIGAWNPAEDSEGLSMPGAKLLTYVAGTTTPKATYPTSTDADAGTNPLTNPVVADSAGRFVEIWSADGGVYDLLWRTAADVDVKLFQTVQALGTSDTGAITRDFGADGRVNIEARGGVTYIEAGAPSPDNTGGTLRLGGWDGTSADEVIIDAKAIVLTGGAAFVLRGHLAGLALSAAGGSGTFGVAAGQAADSSVVALMQLLSSLSKTTAAWAVGTATGGLDTGTIANSTWYHVYLIQRVDTGVVDVVFSTSATSPTLPANYTLYRRIGSIKTDGSAQWKAFAQLNDEFLWLTPTTDVSATVSSTTAALGTINTPLGVRTTAIVSGNARGGASGIDNGWLISSPDLGGLAASAAILQAGWTMSQSVGAAQVRVRTNTSSQVYYAMLSASSTTWTIATHGWVDERGKGS